MGTNQTITKDVGIRMCEALVAYDDDRYADAVDVLHPVRYKLVKIGGSNAQVCIILLGNLVQAIYI